MILVLFFFFSALVSSERYMKQSIQCLTTGSKLDVKKCSQAWFFLFEVFRV